MKRKQKRTQINFKRTVLATALLIEMGLGAVQAATINVDGTTCTLADAITSANTDAATGGCTAGTGDDVLELTAAGTITLTAALPEITTNITINGNTSTVTRDSGSAASFRIFTIDEGDLTISNTTITGGISPTNNFGGGLQVLGGGSLNMDNCLISGNTGGAISFAYALSSTIANSVIDNNDGVVAQYYGGGINILASQVVISNSTISNNTTISTSAGGGGVYITNYGGSSSVLIENTTITGNSSTLRGGGISHIQYGNTTSLTINNSTISGNTSDASGGGISLDNTVTGTFTNLTVTANDSGDTGGGLDMSGSSITLAQSLIAGNTATGVGREVNVSGGTLTVDDFNLFGFGGDSGLNGIAAGASDLEPADTIAAILDPVLADNGGNTFTHNLVPTSPALNAVPDASCALTSDQRGFARPNGGNCEIGAIEVALFVDGTVCTLADAITAANTDAATGGCPAGDGDDVLELNVDGLYTLTEALPKITTNITINGNGSTVTRVPGSATEFRIFDAYIGNFNLNDTTVAGGVESENFGAGIQSINNQINIDNCVFTENNGGAIRFLYTTSSSITNSIIDGNTNSTESFYSAGVNLALSQVVISNSTISNNTTQSTNGSGGLYLYSSSSVLVENSIISGNSSIASGGGISHVEGYIGGTADLTVNNSTISGNTTDGAGGGLFFDNSIVTVLTNLTVTDNIAAGDGGGIGIAGSASDVTLIQSLVAGNGVVGAGREVNVGGGGSTLTVDAYNLFGFGGDSGLVGVTAGASDLEPSKPLATILDTTLADNGGDTLTHNLVATSPAVDTVPTVDCALTADQRGLVRPGGNGCDIGAVESPFDDVIFKNGFD